MGLFFAWAVGEGIIVARWMRAKAPPTPGALILPAGLFLALAVIAEYQPARGAATLFAWSVDLAILLQITGKNPGVKTGWPPPKIPEGVLLPHGPAGAASPGAAGGAKPGGPGILGMIKRGVGGILTGGL